MLVPRYQGAMHGLFELAGTLVVLFGFGGWDAARNGVAAQRWRRLMGWTLLSAMLGGRVGFILFNISHYAQHPLAIFEIWRGGLVYTAALFAGLTAFLGLAFRSGFGVARLADIAARACLLDVGQHYVLDRVLSFPYPPEEFVKGLSLLAVFVLLMIARRWFERLAGQVALAAIVAYSLVTVVLSATSGEGLQSLSTSPTNLLSAVVFSAALLAFVVRQVRFQVPAGSAPSP